MNEIQDQSYEELCSENEYLKFLLKEEQATIDELAKLCLRAADALETETKLGSLTPEMPEYAERLALVDDLRKAAQ